MPYVYIRTMNPILTILFVGTILTATMGSIILWGGILYTLVKDYIQDRF
jgi:hypothetical protein